MKVAEKRSDICLPLCKLFFHFSWKSQNIDKCYNRQIKYSVIITYLAMGKKWSISSICDFIIISIITQYFIYKTDLLGLKFKIIRIKCISNYLRIYLTWLHAVFKEFYVTKYILLKYKISLHKVHTSYISFFTCMIILYV